MRQFLRWLTNQLGYLLNTIGASARNLRGPMNRYNELLKDTRENYKWGAAFLLFLFVIAFTFWLIK